MTRILSTVVVSLLTLSHVQGDITLPNVISRGMVLQRDRPIPIWGWANPEEAVTVTLGKSTARTKAGAEGTWKVELPPMKADGKAHQLTFRGNNRIVLEDILIGDVWIASGQSNMEKPLGPQPHQTPCLDWKEEVAAAAYPEIRLLEMAPVSAAEPASDSDCEWLPCSPETITLKRGRGHGFSACAYFFARKLHQELNVPIGMIAATWGGTRCEPWTPGAGGELYNGMIAPLTSMSIRGVIWYQGESNVGDGMGYADRMKRLINGWRNAWGYDFPFYFVQLAPFSGYNRGDLPRIWEAQASNLYIPKTGMAVTTDLVNAIRDIHPVNKVDIGNRLALWALAKEHQKNLVYSGPLYKSMKVEGDKIRLFFSHVGGGLKSRDNKPLIEFEIAGADGQFVPAEARIDGDTVVMKARKVNSPVQVRFGWSNEANPNLVNREGLPASPFRTSDWRGGTGE